MRVVRVALDVPLPTLFDYALPTALGVASDTLVGRRVIVPFGRGRKVGVVLEAGATPAVEVARIRRLERACEDAALPADVLDLLRFAADYYHHPIGQVVLGALPQRLRQVRAPEQPEATHVELTATGRLTDPGALSPRAVVRRGLLELLRERGPQPVAALRALAPSAGRVLSEMARGGHVQDRKSVV